MYCRVLAGSFVAVATSWLLLAGSSAQAVVIDRVLVGDAGNAANVGGWGNGFGAVGYDFYIGTYNVTNDQYVEFLNAKDPTGSNSLGLYNSGMASSALGGIDFNAGDPDGTKYSAKANMGNKPVNYVSMNDSVRFVNWIANGQGAGDTEDGSYTLTGGGTTPAYSGVRNVGAQYFIPTRDEIFKGSYYDPADPGADATGAQGHGINYWDYATRSDAVPTIGSGDAVGDVSAPGGNVINYNANTWGSGTRVTTVGTAGNSSYYGAFDLSGGVHNWIEASSGATSTGSAASSDLWHLQGGWLEAGWARTHEGERFGFRIASLIASDTAIVPEPQTFALGLFALAAVGLLAWRRRRA